MLKSALHGVPESRHYAFLGLCRVFVARLLENKAWQTIILDSPELGIVASGLNRRAVCSGSRFREQRFQSNLSLLPPERRCEEKGMLSVTKTHQRKGAFP